MWSREQDTTDHTAQLHQCVCVQCAQYVIYDEVQTQSVGLCFIPLVLRPWWETSRPFSGRESIIHTPWGEREFILYRSTVRLLKKSCSYCRLVALLWIHWHSLVPELFVRNLLRGESPYTHVIENRWDYNTVYITICNTFYKVCVTNQHNKCFYALAFTATLVSKLLYK